MTPCPRGFCRHETAGRWGGDRKNYVLVVVCNRETGNRRGTYRDVRLAGGDACSLDRRASCVGLAGWSVMVVLARPASGGDNAKEGIIGFQTWGLAGLIGQAERHWEMEMEMEMCVEIRRFVVNADQTFGIVPLISCRDRHAYSIIILYTSTGLICACI